MSCSPTACSAKPANIQQPSSAPADHVSSLSSPPTSSGANGSATSAAIPKRTAFSASGEPVASTTLLITACCEPHSTVTPLRMRSAVATDGAAVSADDSADSSPVSLAQSASGAVRSAGSVEAAASGDGSRISISARTSRVARKSTTPSPGWRRPTRRRPS